MQILIYLCSIVLIGIGVRVLSLTKVDYTDGKVIKDSKCKILGLVYLMAGFTNIALQATEGHTSSLWFLGPVSFLAATLGGSLLAETAEPTSPSEGEAPH